MTADETRRAARSLAERVGPLTAWQRQLLASLGDDLLDPEDVERLWNRPPAADATA